jgi:hypothetical protein
LGIDLDTEKQEARLPDEKLEKCFNLVEAFLHRKNVTLEEIHYFTRRLGLSNPLSTRTTFPKMFVLGELPDMQNSVDHKESEFLPLY